MFGIALLFFPGELLIKHLQMELIELKCLVLRQQWNDFEVFLFL